MPGSITLRVDETPVITASTDQQFCLGTYGGVELAVSGVTVGGSVVWSPTNGLSSFNQDTVYALPNSTTTYTATVTDSSGYCSVQEDVTVNVTDLVLTPTTTNATCAVLGTATVAVSGGSGSYSYQWSYNETTSSISNLQPGTYTVVVTDNNLGCMDSIDAIVQAGANTLTAEAVVSNELCADANDGQIIVNAIAGTAPYNFEWVELGITNSSTQSDTMSNLSPGVYNVNVTDANGCLFEVTANIAEADSFVVIQDSVHATTCLGLFDGYVRLRIDGGQTPYTFAWSNGMAVDIQDGDVVAQDLGPGIYTLYISDSRVCTDSFVVDFTVDSVPTYITDTLICYGTTIDAFGTNVIIENDTSFQDTIYEASGCATQINIINVEMLDLPSATVTADPDTIFEQQTSVLTATSGFNYDWNPESSSNTNSITVSPTETTEYSLIVSDENGCENTYSVTV
ncbi:MAG: SprB repeat-containing protein [Chitinophagales bacterium]